ncbi:ABC transporter permease subunit [Arthrobacter sp. AZCC_0090]|uniref:branched-chain amino acid ABC transporter ATP-binding protein/permease n=1 Tax=Arthrobacter sp. AZCC_0090 TaxID=2735881 RepID=UPI001621BAF5|nr:ATP-binding cassette domain-containing protein [Arthrobacter sp. AZCC_0090]MBB6407124.1 ABC-type branched-subunit amino acid transport system ATPase component/ABC-type branched-subunit amino acid transport system permease subunit [Arthrobacter sp. AZCC_0090]
MTNATFTSRLAGPTTLRIAAPIVLALLGLSVSGNAYMVHIASAGLIAYILTVSFNLIYGYAGIFNMALVMTYGLGAFTSVFLEVKFGFNFWIALLAAVAVTTILAVLVALPTRRLSEVFLAIQTLAFALALAEVVVNWKDFSGGTIGIFLIPPPDFFGVLLIGGLPAYYWLIAVFAWLVFELMLRIQRSAMRRKFTALREGPRILSAVGISSSSTRLVAFAISGALAGLAGVLFAHFQLVMDLDTFSFTRLIALLLAVILGGAGYFWGPLFGVVALVVMDEVSLATSSAQDLVYGIGILVLVILTRGGIAGAFSDQWARIKGRIGLVEPVVTASDTPAGLATAAASVIERVERMVLTERTGTVRQLALTDISVKFGGNTAVDHASVQVSTGEVVGLIGPNGAGKTTLLNTVTGDVPTSSGSIELDLIELIGRRQPEIVRRGIGRTFQSPKYIPDLSVVENVMLGGDGRAKASAIGQAVYSPQARRDDKRIQSRAMELLADFNIAGRAEHPAGAQPYGVLRMIEIARNLMLEPSFLLLDEPGAGLTEFERDEVAAIVRLLSEREIGVLLVDHNLPLITAACDRIYVLQTGKVIAHGVPAKVFAQDEVISAYLGVPK